MSNYNIGILVIIYSQNLKNYKTIRIISYKFKLTWCRGTLKLNSLNNEKTRLPASFFEITDELIDKIKNGYFTDVYFLRALNIINRVKKENKDYRPRFLMNIFSRHKKGKAVVCGLDYSIRLIQSVSSGEVEINALYDGDIIGPNETVMTLAGHLEDFITLETVYLGIIARATKVATRSWEVVEASLEKKIPILFFPARFDLFSNQSLDGYAGHISGVLGVSTEAQSKWWGGKPLGTIPHAIIAYFKPGEFEGRWKDSTVEATKWFARLHPNVNCISLVDFENNCPETSLKVATALEDEGLNLWGVRLDTSSSLIDFSIIENGQLDAFDKTGVNPTLVCNVRDILDDHGFTRDKVKIVVSGGFDADKIRYYAENNVPIDAIGVGSSLFKGNIDFTADIVAYEKNNEWISCGKVGRPYPKDLTRLERVV